MQWYYAKGGQQHGPISENEIAERLRNGELKAGDLIWREGMSAWEPISSQPQFAVSIPATSAPQAPPVSGNPYQSPASHPSMQPGYYSGPPIPNYLWQSIVVTILCCPPFGIPAIVYAARVDGLRQTGDHAGAKHASDQAKLWCWVSFGCGIAGVALYVLLMFASLAGSV